LPFFKKAPQHADFPVAAGLIVSISLAIESDPPRPRLRGFWLRWRLFGELTDSKKAARRKIQRPQFAIRTGAIPFGEIGDLCLIA
jgi:hypothetical protein